MMYLLVQVPSALARSLPIDFVATYQNAVGAQQETRISDTSVSTVSVAPITPPVTNTTDSGNQSVDNETAVPAVPAVPMSTSTVTPPTSPTESPSSSGAVVVEKSTETANTAISPPATSLSPVPAPAVKKTVSNTVDVNESRWPWVAGGLFVLSIFIVAVLIKKSRRRQSNIVVSGSELTLDSPLAPTEPHWNQRAFVAGMGVLVMAVLVSTFIYIQQHRSLMADVVGRVDKGKYVITFGWEDPSVDYLIENQDKFSSYPFDGMVVNKKSLPAIAGGTPLNTGVFSDKSLLQLDWYQPAWEKWQTLHSLSSLAHSLLLVNSQGWRTADGRCAIDDDAAWDSYINHNWEVAAQVVKNAQLDGMLIDTESYTGISMYAVPPTYNGVDLSTVSDSDGLAMIQPLRDKAEERGEYLAQTLNSIFTDRPVEVMLTVTNSKYYSNQNITADNIWRTSYGLLDDMIDGFLKVAGPNVHLHDGFESSYPTRATAGSLQSAFLSLRQNINGIESAVAKRSQDPVLYSKAMGAGFGIWLDRLKATMPWYFQKPDGTWWSYSDASGLVPVDSGSVELNYFTPSVLTQTLNDALRVSDRYVWLYYERMDIYGAFTATFDGTGNAGAVAPTFGNEYFQALGAVHDSYLDNEAPVLSVIADQQLIAGHDWQLTLPDDVSADADGDTVVYSAADQPSDFHFNARQRSFQWRPVAEDVGDHLVTLTASDGTATDSQSIKLVVASSSPSLDLQVASGVGTVQVGDLVDYHISYNNSGNDSAVATSVAVTVPQGLVFVSSSVPAVQNSESDIVLSLNDISVGQQGSADLQLRLAEE